jgi:pilus assembly protein CpaF
MVLDNASPIVLGHLSKNIRIAVLKNPIVDEDVGVAASIRIVNPQSMKKADFVRGGTATEPMLDFLSLCVRYGISVCVAGATSSGKTTVAGWVLTTVPDNKRIYTIENGSRELALVREQDGRVVNSVIHTLTRDSDNDRQRIDQISLLDMALRFNPDIIVVGEMRGGADHHPFQFLRGYLPQNGVSLQARGGHVGPDPHGLRHRGVSHRGILQTA